MPPLMKPPPADGPDIASDEERMRRALGLSGLQFDAAHQTNLAGPIATSHGCRTHDAILAAILRHRAGASHLPSMPLGAVYPLWGASPAISCRSADDLGPPYLWGRRKTSLSMQPAIISY